jgi:hypothetical protein
MIRSLSKKEKLFLAVYYLGCAVVLLPLTTLIAFISDSLILTFFAALIMGLLIGVLGGKIEFEMRYVYTRTEEL